MALRTPAVFVDRDGTLIREVGYLARLDQIELLPRVTEAIRLLQSHGLKVVMVTNQSAVARRIISEQQLHQIHREIERALDQGGAYLDGLYYCPHHPTEGIYPYRVSCRCRKPQPGLVEQACLDLGLDAHVSYVIGDQMSDMELAARTGAKGILIESQTLRGGRSGGKRDEPPFVPVTDFWTATRRIVEHHIGKGTLQERCN